MTDTLQAPNAKDVEDAVGWALAEGKTLEVAGQGSKRGLGRPSQSDLTLDLSGLSGVTLYEPEELVLSAKAGTPIAEIEKLVAEKGQELAFEPADYGPVFGLPAGAGTIGGVLATNLSGPRRIKAGAARDHFLGLTAVSGRGETFKSGGRVVKNVTGYDLCKLLSGSFGTLAAMTDVTDQDAAAKRNRSDRRSHRSRRCTPSRRRWPRRWDRRATSPARRICPRMSCGASRVCMRRAVTAFRLEGVKPSVTHRRDMLAALLKPFGAVEVARREAFARDLARRSATLRPSPRPATAMSGRSGACRPRPAKASNYLTMISPGAQMFYDWGGGLVWILMPTARRGRRRTAASGRNARRTRDAGARARIGSRRHRRVPATGRSGCGLDQAGQGQLRSQGHTQSRTDVGGRLKMQTNFTLAQLADPDIAEANQILRACVHCGFCTATCPTYVLLGDELDSPRGRIYLIKEMLENDRPATAEVVKHVDRCLRVSPA